MKLKLKPKPKPIFYCNGNAQKFDDDCLIANMTKEPLPKKWQEFFELTPEQKALWDADLRLDAEYRIAEAQGFPNGIPGGTTRGNVFYFRAQREEEYKRECREVQEEYAGDYAKHFSLRQKTDILDKNKRVMEYYPYRDMTNDVLADSSAMNEQMDLQLSTVKIPSMGKIKSLHSIGVPNNTVAEAASNMDADLSLWENANQPSYKFSRNLLDGYGQNGGMNDRFLWNRTANSSMNNGGQGSEDWIGRTSLTDGLLFSERSLDRLQEEYKTIYDATIKKHGSWDGAISALSQELKGIFSGIGTFSYEWGNELAELLLTKAPFPPQVKTAIAVYFFMKAVYEIVHEVQTKRNTKINELESKHPEWKRWEVEDEANKSVNGWLIQAIGGAAVKAVLGKTMGELNLNGIEQSALNTAWNRFVQEAKAGRWERRT